MKMVLRLGAAAIVMLLFMAPVAFARGHHHSHRAASAEKSFPEMTITEQWTPDDIVAPPVTRPSGVQYDTPKPHLTDIIAPLPSEVASAPIGTPGYPAPNHPTEDRVPTGANPTGDNAQPVTTSPAESMSANASATTTAATSMEHAKTSPLEMMSATLHGAKIDGASISAPQNGVQTAALITGGPSGQKSGARTAGSILFDETRDDSPLDPTSWSVNVFKHRQALIVYFKGRLFKQYDAVFGRALDLGAKQWAQDRRTPEGVYTIIEKYRSARFHWFLRLNYPNLVDRVRYETQRINGVIPVDGEGKSPTVGSAIGIHGTDVPILNAGHINWTTGCISVSNKDIDDLERLLPVGTVVIIKP